MYFETINGSFCGKMWSVILWSFCLRMTYALEKVTRSSSSEGPLEFSDILPQNPKEYDKMQPPKENGTTTVVHFHVTVMSLDSIDESSMTYAADIFFAQTWKDHRLRLPDNMTSEYRLLPVNWLNDMWRPDSFFKNAKKVTFQDMTIPNHYIWLYKDKTILYMVKLTLILSCAMNFKSYPHDTQQCAMQIESLSHTTDDLVFKWDADVPLVVDDKIELPQLDLVQNTTGDCTHVYATGNFTCLEVIFTFKRRLGYYLFHTYVPTCLIVIMSWISFWIRPEAVPARVTLGVTSLLTLSTQHANSQKSLPPVSYIKAIDIFMSGCTVFVFFSLMEYALVNVVLGDVIEAKESFLRKRLRSICVAARTAVTRKKEPQPTQQRAITHELQSNYQITQPIILSRSSIIQPVSQSHIATISIGEPPSIPPPPPPPHLPPTLKQFHTESGLTIVKRVNHNGAVAQVTPNRASGAAQALQAKKRDTAIAIDRFSRIIFPISFSVLNVIYWCVYLETM